MDLLGALGRRTQKTQHGIETGIAECHRIAGIGRRTQKTQHGIETCRKSSRSERCQHVAELRKPSTGLKPFFMVDVSLVRYCRRTQKTQHGIETRNNGNYGIQRSASQNSENPARD